MSKNGFLNASKKGYKLKTSKNGLESQKEALMLVIRELLRKQNISEAILRLLKSYNKYKKEYKKKKSTTFKTGLRHQKRSITLLYLKKKVLKR